MRSKIRLQAMLLQLLCCESSLEQAIRSYYVRTPAAPGVLSLDRLRMCISSDRYCTCSRCHAESCCELAPTCGCTKLCLFAGRTGQLARMDTGDSALLPALSMPFMSSGAAAPPLENGLLGSAPHASGAPPHASGADGITNGLPHTMAMPESSSPMPAPQMPQIPLASGPESTTRGAAWSNHAALLLYLAMPLRMGRRSAARP